MPERLLVPAAVAALLFVMPASLRAQTLSSEQGWTAIGECAARSERARHACLDDVLRRAGLLTPQAEARDRQRQFGLEDARAATPPPAPPAVPVAPAPTAPAPLAKVETPAADRLEVEVARAITAADGKVVVATTDGAVWRQVDSDTIQRLPSAGQRVKIRKASLGSFLCELPSRVTFRCQRTK